MGNIKILVVDDTEAVRSQLKNVLEPVGFEVIEAEDGMVGLKKVEECPDIKLLISDLNMPNMDGLTMCEQLKKRADFKIPILILTTEANPEMKAEGKRIGVRAWIVKPFQPDKLIQVVKLLTAS